MSTDHALVIYETLQGVNGARLVVKGEEAMLIVLQHEHANKVSMERFPLGSSMDVADLVKLLDGLGLIEVSVAVSGHERAPARKPAKRDATHLCPECAFAAKSRGGLGVHRRSKHGIVSPDSRSRAKAAPRAVQVAPVDPQPLPVASDGRGVCDVCGAPWTGHARCDECAALLGPGHTHDGPETVIRGKALCPGCVRIRRRAEVAA